MKQNPVIERRSRSRKDRDEDILAFFTENPEATVEQMSRKFHVRKGVIRAALEAAGRKTHSQLARVDPLAARMPLQPYLDVRAVLIAEGCQLVVLASANIDGINETLERGLALQAGEHLPLSPFGQDRLRIAAFCKILDQGNNSDCEKDALSVARWLERIPCNDGEKLFVIAAASKTSERAIKEQIARLHLSGFVTISRSLAGSLSHCMLSPEFSHLGLGAFPSLAISLEKLRRRASFVLSVVHTHSALRLRILAATKLAESGIFFGEEHEPLRGCPPKAKKFRRKEFTLSLLAQRATKSICAAENDVRGVPLIPMAIGCEDIRVLPDSQNSSKDDLAVVEIEAGGTSRAAIVFNSESLRSAILSISKSERAESIVKTAQGMQNAFREFNSKEPLIECARLLNFDNHWAASIGSLVRLARHHALQQFENGLLSCLILLLLDAQFSLHMLGNSGKWQSKTDDILNKFTKIVEDHLERFRGPLVGEMLKMWASSDSADTKEKLNMTFDDCVQKVLIRESRLFLPLVLTLVAQSVHAEIAKISERGLSSLPLAEVVAKKEELLVGLSQTWPHVYVNLNTLTEKLRNRLRGDFRDEVRRLRRESEKAQHIGGLNIAAQKNGQSMPTVVVDDSISFAGIVKLVRTLSDLASLDARVASLEAFEQSFFSKVAEAKCPRGSIRDWFESALNQQPLGDDDLEKTWCDYVSALECEKSTQIEGARGAFLSRVALVNVDDLE